MLLVTQYKMATSTITLRTIDGQNRTMTVSSDMKIIDLKRKIADEFPNFAVGSQRLIYRGCVLEDAKRLPDYSISDGHVVHLVEQAPSERPAQQQPQQQQEGLSSAVIGGSPHVLAAPHSGAAVVFGSFPVPGSLPLDPATVTQSIIEHVINPNVLNPQGTQSQSSNAHTSGSPAVMATAASLMSAQEESMELSYRIRRVRTLLTQAIADISHYQTLVSASDSHHGNSQSGEAHMERQDSGPSSPYQGLSIPAVVVGPVTGASLADVYKDTQKLLEELSSLLQAQILNLNSGQQLSGRDLWRQGQLNSVVSRCFQCLSTVSGELQGLSVDMTSPPPRLVHFVMPLNQTGHTLWNHAHQDHSHQGDIHQEGGVTAGDMSSLTAPVQSTAALVMTSVDVSVNNMSGSPRSDSSSTTTTGSSCVSASVGVGGRSGGDHSVGAGGRSGGDHREGMGGRSGGGNSEGVGGRSGGGRQSVWESSGAKSSSPDKSESSHSVETSSNKETDTRQTSSRQSTSRQSTSRQSTGRQPTSRRSGSGTHTGSSTSGNSEGLMNRLLSAMFGPEDHQPSHSRDMNDEMFHVLQMMSESPSEPTHHPQQIRQLFEVLLKGSHPATVNLSRVISFSKCHSESLSMEFCHILSQSMTVAQFMDICSGRDPPLTDFHQCCYQFLKSSVLCGQEPSSQNRRESTEKLVQTITHFLLECWADIRVRGSMDLKRSMEKCLRIELYKLIKMVVLPPKDSAVPIGQLLFKQCQYAVAMLVGVVRHCSEGTNSAFKQDVIFRAAREMLKPLFKKNHDPTIKALFDNVNSVFAEKMINWPLTSADLNRYMMWKKDQEVDVYGKHDEEETMVPMETDKKTIPNGENPVDDRHMLLTETHPPREFLVRSWPAGMPREWIAVLQHDSHLLHDTLPQAPSSDVYERETAAKKRKVIQETISSEEMMKRIVHTSLEESRADSTSGQSSQEIASAAASNKELVKAFQDEMLAMDKRN